LIRSRVGRRHRDLQTRALARRKRRRKRAHHCGRRPDDLHTWAHRCARTAGNEAFRARMRVLPRHRIRRPCSSPRQIASRLPEMLCSASAVNSPAAFPPPRDMKRSASFSAGQHLSRQLMCRPRRPAITPHSSRRIHAAEQ
jgi:hypothetical protein